MLSTNISIEDKIEILKDRISSISNYTNELNHDLSLGLIAEDQIEPTNIILSRNQAALIQFNDLLTNLEEML